MHHFCYDFAFICVAVSITFTPNGDSVAGSEFSITATVSIIDEVDVHTLNITWLDSSGSEKSSEIESLGSGSADFDPSGSLDLVFTNLLLSQAGVYTFMAIITDTESTTVTLQRTYGVTVQSKCSYLAFNLSSQFQCMHDFINVHVVSLTFQSPCT